MPTQRKSKRYLAIFILKEKGLKYLQEEVVARMQAEKRLNEAEESLHKLGHAVEHETPNVHHEVKEEMVVNVNKLKRKILL